MKSACLAYRRIVVALTVGASLASVAVFSPTSEVHADNLPPLGIIIRGHGYGHGRGLSQYGALGWATKLNADWQAILNFYYGGSGRTVAALTAADAPSYPDGNMTTRLVTLDGAQTAVISDNATAAWSGNPTNYGALLARSTGRNTYDVYGASTATCPSASGTPAGFTLLARNATGPITFTSARGADPAAVAPVDLLGLCEPTSSTFPKGRLRFYRGAIRAANDANGALRTVNIAPLDSYIRGVVPRESPAGWGDIAGGLGMNALRAQAVAARSYSLTEKRYSFAKTCDTQDCQVYGGAALRTVGSTSTTVIEDARTDRAIAETANIVIKDANQAIVRTEFTSSNGGRTAGGQFPAQIDNGDLIADAALQNWTVLLTAAQLQKAYPTIGVLLSVVAAHDGLGGEWNGYTTTVTITGTAGVVTRTAWQFRSDFDLNAPWYEAFPIAPADPAAAPVGSILYVGDSVGESIANEFAAIVTPAYSNMNFQSCAGRGMAGADCLFPVVTPQLDLDGVGVVNALPAPAIAIVELGYNDDPNTFDAELQQMISALTAKAVQRIIFINMSTRATSKNFARSNAALLAVAAANPAVSIFDWNTASSAANQWRWFDNTSLCCWVHLSNSGQTEFALFLRQQLDDLRVKGLLPVTASNEVVIPGLPLQKSHKGVMVQSVQKKLNALLALKGNKRLVTDGAFGTGTIKAVKAFQTTANLPVTGTIDRTTWNAMGLADRVDLAILKVGSVQPAVASVQRALAKVLKKKISATGTFTSSLANDVKTFQKRAGLPANGRIGPNTWAVLMTAAARA
jgi:SpoIID/LytB domain protein